MFRSTFAISFCLFAFLPFLIWHGRNLWESSQYQFFPILVLAIIAILKERLPAPRVWLPMVAAIHWPFLAPIFAGLGLLLLSVLVETPNAAMIALLLFSAGYVWFLASKLDISLWGPWALGWLLVCLPSVVEVGLTSQLQLLSSTLSSRLLDVVGVNHLMTGNVLHLDGQDLFVDQACSGVVSLFSILAFGAMFAVWQRYPLVRSVLLLVIGVGWTILLNVLRITIIAISDQWYDLDLVHGWPHTMLGMVLFLVTLAGFYCSDQLLGGVLRPIPEDVDPDRGLNFTERVWNYLTAAGAMQGEEYLDDERVDPVQTDRVCWRFSHSFMIALSLMILMVWVGRQLFTRNLDFTNSTSVSLVANVDPSLADRICESNEKCSMQEITRESTDPSGAYSKVFSVEGVLGHRLSIDYPFFMSWHELTNCYVTAGWRVIDRSVVTLDNIDFVEVDLVNDFGETGFLIFAQIHLNGDACYVPDTGKVLEWYSFEMKRRFLKGFTGEVIQLQLFQSGVRELTPEQKEELRQQFLTFRQAAYQKMFPDRVDVGND